MNINIVGPIWSRLHTASPSGTKGPTLFRLCLLGTRINPLRIPAPHLWVGKGSLWTARCNLRVLLLPSDIRQIAKQEQIIADLDRNGKDIAVTLARQLLTMFRRIQDHNVAHRDRILKELDQ